MTNEQLVARIQAGENTAENMLLLWQQTKGFIYSIVHRYAGAAEIEDLEQEGYLSLYDAIDGYEPDRGCKFLTYAEPWIKQHVVRYIQNNGTTVRIPVHERQKMQEYKKMVNTFQGCTGRKPSRREIALCMQLSDKQVTGIEKALEMAQIGSLDCDLSEEDSGTIGDMIAANEDVEGDVISAADQELLKEILWPMVDALPGDQGPVIRARYQEGKTLKETGKQMGVTIERVRQIENKALRELRSPSRVRVLNPYLDAAIYSKAIRGCGVARFDATWTSSTERTALQMAEGFHSGCQKWN